MGAPLWSLEDMAAKQGLIKARAYQHWRRWEGALDRSFLDDLEQEGWGAALAHTPDDPYLAQKVDDACRAYIRYWRLGLRGLSTTTSPARKIVRQVPMEHGAVKAHLQLRQDMLPERAALLREAIRRVWDQSTTRMRLVWWAMLLQDSLYLKRMDQRRLHLSETQVSRARKQLQAVARQVMRDDR